MRGAKWGVGLTAGAMVGSFVIYYSGAVASVRENTLRSQRNAADITELATDAKGINARLGSLERGQAAIDRSQEWLEAGIIKINETIRPGQPLPPPPRAKTAPRQDRVGRPKS